MKFSRISRARNPVGRLRHERRLQQATGTCSGFDSSARRHWAKSTLQQRLQPLIGVQIGLHHCRCRCNSCCSLSLSLSHGEKHESTYSTLLYRLARHRTRYLWRQSATHESSASVSDYAASRGDTSSDCDATQSDRSLLVLSRS